MITGRKSDGAAGFGSRLHFRLDRGRHSLLAGSDCRPQFRPAVGGKRLNEGGAIHFFQFQHKPRRLAIGRLKHGGAGDSRRTAQIEHDPRTPGHHQTITKRLDQSAPGDTGAGGKLES